MQLAKVSSLLRSLSRTLENTQSDTTVDNYHTSTTDCFYYYYSPPTSCCSSGRAHNVLCIVVVNILCLDKIPYSGKFSHGAIFPMHASGCENKIHGHLYPCSHVSVPMPLNEDRPRPGHQPVPTPLNEDRPRPGRQPTSCACSLCSAYR